ncbi:hypothetical protein [Nocardioides sp. TF02-7]|uniref:hypothetical protein n=1 Tax=Nocardioides sp. TF02-7 TaxID=2917724 RepID=UPI0031F5143B
MLTRPDQTRLHNAALSRASSRGADRVAELAEEPGAARRERGQHLTLQLVVDLALRLREGERRLVGEVEGDPPVASRQCAVAGPEHLAGGGELVEVGGLVVADPRRQHQRLEGGGRHRGAGQLLDGAQHPVDAAQPLGRRRDRLPGSGEAGEGDRLDRLDLVAELGE